MISHDVLTEALHRMFEFNPAAICISTAKTSESRYLRVNDAYLALTGRTWEELKSERLVDKTATMSNAKRRRARLLNEQGFYKLEEVDIRHASGRLIPTLISAQRIILSGQAVDLEIIVDNSERKELERQLKQAALMDAATGLANRAAFDAHLASSLIAQPSVGLAFLDLNGFKAVNDREGHAVGDRLIQVIGQRLRARCRASDFVARIGGDEFAIVFKVMHANGGKVRSRMEQLARQVFSPVHLTPLILETSAAIGVAVSKGGECAEDLLRRADTLMYRAKTRKPELAVEF